MSDNHPILNKRSRFLIDLLTMFNAVRVFCIVIWLFTEIWFNSVNWYSIVSLIILTVISFTAINRYMKTVYFLLYLFVLSVMLTVYYVMSQAFGDNTYQHLVVNVVQWIEFTLLILLTYSLFEYELSRPPVANKEPVKVKVPIEEEEEAEEEEEEEDVAQPVAIQVHVPVLESIDEIPFVAPEDPYEAGIKFMRTIVLHDLLNADL